jgi:hypothetical protein
MLATVAIHIARSWRLGVAGSGIHAALAVLDPEIAGTDLAGTVAASLDSGSRSESGSRSAAEIASTVEVRTVRLATGSVRVTGNPRRYDVAR